MHVVPSRTGTNASGMRHHLRLPAWGAGATLALAVAVASGRTELGTERAQSALAAMLSAKPVMKDSSSQVVAWSSTVDAKMRQQADVIHSLAEQRDGLADKVGAMEHQVTELGGTLSRALARIDADAKSAREAATSASTAAAQAAANARLAEAKQQAIELAAAAPAVPGTPRDVAATMPPNAASTPQAVRPSREASAPLTLLPYSQIPGVISTGALGFASAASTPAYTGAIPMPSPEPVAPPVAARPFAGEAQVMAPPAHATPPIPVPLLPPVAPARGASAGPPGGGPLPHGGTKPPAAVQLPQLQSNPLMTAGILNGPVEPGVIAAEFAIDLGGAPTIEALRTRWNELRTSQSPLLDSLRPLVALKEGSNQAGQELRLIAGPLASTAATARLCAVLSGGGVACRPSTFEGQRLTR